MKIIYKIIFLCTLFTSSYSNDTQVYDNFFYYLENKGIIVGEDITTEELFDIINTNKIYDDNGKVNTKLLDNKFKYLFKFKKDEYDKIHKKLQKNPNSKINKEIIGYFKNNNEVVEKKQEELKSKDNDGFISKIINHILELMKF